MGRRATVTGMYCSVSTVAVANVARLGLAVPNLYIRRCYAVVRVSQEENGSSIIYLSLGCGCCRR
jgi:hypothetical protein